MIGHVVSLLKGALNEVNIQGSGLDLVLLLSISSFRMLTYAK